MEFQKFGFPTRQPYGSKIMGKGNRTYRHTLYSHPAPARMLRFAYTLMLHIPPHHLFKLSNLYKSEYAAFFQNVGMAPKIWLSPTAVFSVFVFEDVTFHDAPPMDMPVCVCRELGASYSSAIIL
jgi:hypothetical protein